MIALCGYQLAGFVRSQRWLPPQLLYVAVVAMVYAADAGPAVPTFGVTAMVLFPVAAWQTRVVLGVEDAVARDVTASAAGGQARVQVALLGSALTAALPMVVLAVLWAGVADSAHVQGWQAWLGGLGIHLVFALAGVGLGALAGPPLVGRPGAAAVVIVGVTVLSLLVAASPVGWLLHVLESDPDHGFVARVTPPVVVLLGCAAALMLGSVAVTRRR